MPAATCTCATAPSSRSARGSTRPSAEVIEGAGMVVVPGIHRHAFPSLEHDAAQHAAPRVRIFPGEGSLRPPLHGGRPLPEQTACALAECINAGITTITNFSHNIRSPAHADAELRALQESGLRAATATAGADPTPRNQAMDFADVKRVREQWFGCGSRLSRGAPTSALRCAGCASANEDVVTAEYQFAQGHGPADDSAHRRDQAARASRWRASRRSAT